MKLSLQFSPFGSSHSTMLNANIQHFITQKNIFYRHQ